MTGRDRILATFDGSPVDSLPLMPITMMFAADQIGVPYGRYAADHRTMVEAQIRTAEKFDFDYVSCISDPPARRPTTARRSTISTISRPRSTINQFAPGRQERSRRAESRRPARRRGDAPTASRPRRSSASRVGGQKTDRRLGRRALREAADLRGINRLMTDFYDDPTFVRDLFEFVLAGRLSSPRPRLNRGRGPDRRRRRGRLARRPANLRGVRPPLRAETGRRPSPDGYAACGCTYAAISAESSPASAAWAGEMVDIDSWSRWSRRDAKWTTTRYWPATSIRLKPSATARRNQSPRRLPSAIVRRVPRYARGRRLRNAAHRRGQRRGAA